MPQPPPSWVGTMWTPGVSLAPQAPGSGASLHSRADGQQGLGRSSSVSVRQFWLSLQLRRGQRLGSHWPCGRQLLRHSAKQ